MAASVALSACRDNCVKFKGSRVFRRRFCPRPLSRLALRVCSVLPGSAGLCRALRWTPSSRLVFGFLFLPLGSPIAHSFPCSGIATATTEGVHAKEYPNLTLLNHCKCRTVVALRIPYLICHIHARTLEEIGDGIQWPGSGPQVSRRWPAPLGRLGP